MAIKRHDEIEPYECPKCGAMVFTLEKLHSPLCHDYQQNEALVKNTHDYYKQYLAERLKRVPDKPKTRRKRG